MDYPLQYCIDNQEPYKKKECVKDTEDECPCIRCKWEKELDIDEDYNE